MKLLLTIILFTVLGFLLAARLAAGTTIYVDDDAPGDPGPGDPTVSDPLEDGTAAHPYDAIQEGINAAVSGVDDVLVKDGTYTGTGNKDLDFGGKAITVQSENGPDVTGPPGIRNRYHHPDSKNPIDTGISRTHYRPPGHDKR